MRTGTLLGDLPLGNVQWLQEFSGAALTSMLSARLNLSERSALGGTSLSPVAQRRLTAGFLDGTRTARTILWLYRDEQLLDAFIVWARPKRVGAYTVEVAAAGLTSYFGARLLANTKNYAATDQLSIARDLVDYINPDDNIAGFTIDASNLSGVLRDATPIAWAYERKTIGLLLSNLADNINGFEYSIDVGVVADLPVPTFRTFYPKRGRPYGTTGFLLLRAGDRSGNILDYGITDDATSLVTAVHAIGAGEGDEMMRTVQHNTALLDQGWPVLEAVISHKDVSVIDTLVGHAQAELRRRARRALNGPWEVEVDPTDVSVGFGSWTVGDEVRVVIEDDDRFPAGAAGEPGFDSILRIVGQRVVIPDDGGPESVTLLLEVLDG